jgi:hypothetical protein
MSNVIVKSIGYCVVRRALNIDSDAPSHLINGVFGVFNSVSEAEKFIFSVSDGSVHHTKIERHYHDGEYFWSIHGVRTPTIHHEEKRHEPKKKSTKHAVILTEGKMNRYLSKKFFDKVLSGDPITTFPPSYLQTATYAVDDHALAVEAMHQAKNILHKHPKVKFKVISF